MLGGVYAGSRPSAVPAGDDARGLGVRERGESLLTAPPRASMLVGPGPPRRRGHRSPVCAAGWGGFPDSWQTILRSRGALLRTGAAVRGLERTASGWGLVVGSAAAPEVVEADAVLCAFPRRPPPGCRRPRTGGGGLLGDVETASSAVVTLAVERAGLAELPGSGFLVPPVEGRAIKASTFSFRKWAWTGEVSDEVVHLRASVGRAREEAVLQRDDADLVAVSVAEVGEALGRPLPASSTPTSSGGEVGCRSTPSVTWTVASVRAGRPPARSGGRGRRVRRGRDPGRHRVGRPRRPSHRRPPGRPRTGEHPA